MEEKQLVRNYLQENGIFDLEKGKQLKTVVQLVSYIPWGKGRTIEEVLETKKVGTCTGKHLVLQACFDEIGIEYKPVVCTFKWGEQGIKFPEELQKILDEGEWEHGHNFIQIKKGDGTWIDVDITWNQKLKKYGFKTFLENWGEQSSFVGVKAIRRWNGANIRKMKEKLIEQLSPEVRGRRERFLEAFIEWIDSINKQNE